MTMTHAFDPSLNVGGDADERSSRRHETRDGARAEPRRYIPVTSVRAAMREDIGEGRAWLRGRGVQARGIIQDQPLRATAYAAGIGVMIGLLMRR